MRAERPDSSSFIVVVVEAECCAFSLPRNSDVRFVSELIFNPTHHSTIRFPSVWKMDSKFAICRGEVFRVDACFADGGHEVGVAYPAGHDVQVNVVCDACSGGVAQIHAEVETVRAIGLT